MTNTLYTIGPLIKVSERGTDCRDDFDYRSIVTALGGRAATEVILGYARDEGCLMDDRKAAALLEACGFTIDKRPSLLADARELIRQHRGAVERVARGLLDRGTLSAGEIDQLMEASIPS
jgi:ATP-dependent Zn protease